MLPCYYVVKRVGEDLLNNPSPYKRYKKLIDVTACNVADKVIEMLQKFETGLMNIVELKSYHI